jgi:2-keto-3-deoxy-L-rhamnonate aldolase RhmA
MRTPDNAFKAAIAEPGARFVAVGLETTILARGARELSASSRGAAPRRLLIHRGHR